MLHRIILTWKKTNLIKRIFTWNFLWCFTNNPFPKSICFWTFLEIFVGGLKAIAPLLVFLWYQTPYLSRKKDNRQYK